ncbi:helix-turn-helix domain-containing protein [Streptomyces sp. NPDC058369]|uniref:helix-turn-helix domain-containing protein n=1 Tax=unclassified Streptomyces TaxID=2593676 RepID=UPI0036637FEF
MEQVVERAVRIIRERYAEPLSLDEVARAVLMSKFHLLRVFDQFTGVTPGRFLGAVRMGEAKRLLRLSDLGVATISAEVGYSSTGTFTRRFSESVGVTPTRYRELSRGRGALAVGPPGVRRGRVGRCRVRGVVRAAAEPDSPVCIGAFDGPILQGQPFGWTTTDRLGSFCLPLLPQGVCHVHAAMRAAAGTPGRPVVFTAVLGPLRLDPFADCEVELVLRPRTWSQPPILFAIPGIEVPAQTESPAPSPAVRSSAIEEKTGREPACNTQL